MVAMTTFYVALCNTHSFTFTVKYKECHIYLVCLTRQLFAGLTFQQNNSDEKEGDISVIVNLS